MRRESLSCRRRQAGIAFVDTLILLGLFAIAAIGVARVLGESIETTFDCQGATIAGIGAPGGGPGCGTSNGVTLDTSYGAGYSPGESAGEAAGLSSAPAASESRVTENYGDAIELSGPPDAVDRARDDLERIRGTRAGGDLLDWLERDARANGHRIRVGVSNSGTGVFQGGAATLVSSVLAEARAWPAGHRRTLEPGQSRFPVGADGRIAYTGPGTPIAADLIRVGYDAGFNPTYPDGTPCRPPFLSLAHELLHVRHAREGLWLRGIDDPVTGEDLEEVVTIGFGPYAGDEGTENAMRRELGIPERNTHETLCGPR